MVTLMRSMIPAPKGRIRTPVGHRYLEALQAHAEGRKSTSASALSVNSNLNSTSSQNGERLELLILGISASATAADDIDLALCRFSQDDPEAPLRLELIKHDTIKIASRIRDELLSMLREDVAARPSMIPQMDVEVGQAFANAVHVFAQNHDIAVDDIDLIGSGGLLVTLNGMPQVGQHRSNICLGEGAVISANTGVTIVSDFRTVEQAVGRQGAPLFAYLIGLLLHHPSRLQICISIGAVSSVCFVPPDSQGGIDAMYDWDTGPGTALLDTALRVFGIEDMKELDPSLQNGIACLDVLDDVLANNEYLRTRPPKTTTASEAFGDRLAHEMIAMCEIRGCTRADILATLMRLTSSSIAQQILLYGPGRDAINNADIVIETRGVFSAQLVSDLKSEFPSAMFSSFDHRTGIPSQAKTAVGFAMQAMEAILGRALPVPTNADVRRPNTITGKLAPGVRWREVIEKSVAFGGSGRGWEGLPEVRELIVKRAGT